jgi:hypothetical protein
VIRVTLLFSKQKKRKFHSRNYSTQKSNGN